MEELVFSKSTIIQSLPLKKIVCVYILVRYIKIHVRFIWSCGNDELELFLRTFLLYCLYILVKYFDLATPPPLEAFTHT